MIHVAEEMQRQQFTIPLLIGGATTSRAHTAIKIEPNYHAGPTIHVVDASRAVGVASQLLSKTQEAPYVAQIRKEYQELRARHQHKKSEAEMISLDEARANRYPIEWAKDAIHKPSFLGIKTFIDYPLQDLVATIDWTPFFSTWELSGQYPDILTDDVVGESAKSLFSDAEYLLKTIIAEKWIKANAVIGFFPANSIGDDIEIYTDDTRTKVLTTLHMLRQQTRKASGKYNMCLADFIAPAVSGIGGGR